ncbi:MAG TPA: T9SS type A sorting domain-containing protein, partial [Rhodothermales bacterium]|nr:T9SS type A sorting domain-containing protein [Rhodothermales bacterium]
VLGNTGGTDRPVVLDRLPSVTVTSPADRSLTRGSVALAATCTDDEGACTFRVSAPDGVPVVGTGAVSGPLDLSAYAGREVTITFSVTDARNQATVVTRRVYVEPSPYWQDPEVAAGLIVRATPTRLLIWTDPYVDTGGTEQWRGLAVVDRQTGVTTPIPLPAGREPGNADLTDTGAVFIADSVGATSTSSRLYDWNGGTLYDLSRPNASGSLRANGRYLTWITSPTPGVFALYLRDLVTRTTTLVDGDVSYNIGYAPAADGRIVYQRGRPNAASYLYVGGTSTLFADGHARDVQFAGDSTYYVYVDGSAPPSIRLHDGSTHHILAEDVTDPGPSSIGAPSYHARGGWLAFTRLSPSGVTHVWRRSPDGAEQQLTFFATSSVLEGVSPTGEVMIRGTAARYLADPAGTLITVGTRMGYVLRLETGWHLFLGPNLLAFNQALVPAEDAAPPPTAAALDAVAPNPTASGTTVTFSLPESMPVRLTVYDVIGRRIATLAEGARGAGVHTVTWTAAGVPSGVYTVVLEAGATRATRRLTVTR